MRIASATRIGTLLLVHAALVGITRPALAVWNTQSGTVVCQAPTDQQNARVVSDGVGGVITVWQDHRNGLDDDVYAQRLTAYGDAAWAQNGIPIVALPSNQVRPVIASDGQGGAIIAWVDRRNGTDNNIFAQRVTGDGTALWGTNGLSVCTAPGDQINPTIVSDGAGGAVLAWEDRRAGSIAHIFAKRINGSGTAQWAPNGVQLTNVSNRFDTGAIAVTDGSGGAIVVFQGSIGFLLNIYTRRINAAGAPLWAANGVTIADTTGAHLNFVLDATPTGGAIVAWEDYRTGTESVFAQALDSSGLARWGSQGIPVTIGVGGTQHSPSIASDGGGGAIFAWGSGSDGYLHAQKIYANAGLRWTNAGIQVTSPGAMTGVSTLVPTDPPNGVLAMWQGGSTGNFLLFAQHLDVFGTAQWHENSNPYITLFQTGDQLVSVSDVEGGFIVVRRQPDADYDIFAERVESHGLVGAPEPQIAAVRDVPDDQGGHVQVLWSPSYLDFSSPGSKISSYVLWRRIITTAPSAQTHPAPAANVSPGPGSIRVTTEGDQSVYWDYIVTVPALGRSGYAYDVATTADSMPGLTPYQVFEVDALDPSDSFVFSSRADSGYSVDNIPPGVPSPFSGAYVSGTSTLHWGRNTERDLFAYRLHRGTFSGFVPSPSNLVVATVDTFFADVAGAPYFHKLSAVDDHGNESGFALLQPSGTTDAPHGGTSTLFLAPAAPNPVHDESLIRFGLAREDWVTLAIFDQQGRRVRGLVSGIRPAGAQSMRWDRRDDAGRAVPSGFYFLRLEAQGLHFTERLVAIR